MTRRILVMFAVLAAIAIGLGFYALHLKRKVARDAQTAAEQQLAMAAPETDLRAGDLVHCERQRRHPAQNSDYRPLAGGA